MGISSIGRCCSHLITAHGSKRVNPRADGRFARRLAGFAACLLFAAAAAGAADEALVFNGGWVRATPPGTGMTAGFGTLTNRTDEAIEITGFASPDFAEVSLHRTEVADGVSRMIEVPALHIDPGAAVSLAPGGYHLMLMGPIRPMQDGEPVTLRFIAEDGRTFEFPVPVERR